MRLDDTGFTAHATHDKRLQGIVLESVLEKRRLGQALNAKEFAVCAGISYSTARAWFRLPGFPAFHGVIFWTDFDLWRLHQAGLDRPAQCSDSVEPSNPPLSLSARAAQSLFES
jgi:hypothetical protein